MPSLGSDLERTQSSVLQADWQPKRGTEGASYAYLLHQIWQNALMLDSNKT